MTNCLITGVTGFLGGHLAEACAAEGMQVRGLVRPSVTRRADAATLAFLDSSRITLVHGDLQDPSSLPAALDGVDVVFHAAAKVGDWGPVEDYRQVNVEGTRHLLLACQGRPLRRFVHFSSLGVYAARHHHGSDETEPLPEQHIDGYTQSKVEAERLALRFQREQGVPVVVLRPGFIYGPRDRTVLPKLVENLKKGVVRYLGSGEQALNTIYVGNLVQAALLAAKKDGVVGEVFNLTDGEAVSKRRFIDGIADGLGIARPKGSVPLWLARVVANVMEGIARAVGARQPPRLTQARLKFLGLNLDFSIDKARRQLGYTPLWSFDRGLAETLAWYRHLATT